MSKQTFDVIVLVPGILFFKSYWSGWEKDLRIRYPKAEFILFRDCYYLWHTKRQYKVVQELQQIFHKKIPDSSSKRGLVLGHSFGGLLAGEALAQISNNKWNFIALATPWKLRWILRRGKDVRFPKITFGGYFDLVVLWFVSSASKIPRQFLWTTHLGFLHSKKIREKIFAKF